MDVSTERTAPRARRVPRRRADGNRGGSSSGRSPSGGPPTAAGRQAGQRIMERRVYMGVKSGVSVKSHHPAVHSPLSPTASSHPITPRCCCCCCYCFTDSAVKCTIIANSTRKTLPPHAVHNKTHPYPSLHHSNAQVSMPQSAWLMNIISYDFRIGFKFTVHSVLTAYEEHGVKISPIFFSLFFFFSKDGSNIFTCF